MGRVTTYPETYAITPPKGADGPPETEVPILQAILSTLSNGGGGGGGQGVISVNGVSYAYDYQAFTYYGATNNVHTISYKSGGSGGTQVAIQYFSYAGGGASNDDLVTVISTQTS